MSSEQVFFIAATVVAVSGLFLSTGGASSIAATHTVDVATAGDGSAYLGFEQTTQIANGTTVLDLTVTNQHSSETAFRTVDVTINGTTVDIIDGGRLTPGDGVTHTVRSVDCGESVTVAATGPETTIRIERSVACG